ncbi:hypothetical protein STA1M1_11810 [Sinisalibacter aestuarii]|uniref:Uncharacterized protein n=1 Tax=Sinisalibacter aestuarii TaxID=2949426 RepID=A0ABQ5LQM8_9RHOB|nr:hypothetical protein STA1M1_11810 [Sinisalibacter aestuarii]
MIAVPVASTPITIIAWVKITLIGLAPAPRGRVLLQIGGGGGGVKICGTVTPVPILRAWRPIFGQIAANPAARGRARFRPAMRAARLSS